MEIKNKMSTAEIVAKATTIVKSTATGLEDPASPAKEGYRIPELDSRGHNVLERIEMSRQTKPTDGPSIVKVEPIVEEVKEDIIDIPDIPDVPTIPDEVVNSEPEVKDIVDEDKSDEDILEEAKEVDENEEDKSEEVNDEESKEKGDSEEE